MKGQVYLVGAGPGDPGLLTLRAAELLARADLVLYDYLANPEILVHTRRDCERICLGQHGGKHGEKQEATRIWSQEEINARLVEAALVGRQVVRLKGGDPAIFGRLAEEVECLIANRIPYEIVPGITAAFAATAYAGIPLTHREVASGVALITAQENAGKATSSLDYASLARFPGTLVFYMGATTARVWSTALIAAGKPAETPAAIVRRCSLSDQQTIFCRLGEVADRLERPVKLRPPLVTIVGELARREHALAWFEERPLFGRTILITRPNETSDRLAWQLSEWGARVLSRPAIEISDPEDWAPVDAALARLEEFDWLVFSSVHGVEYFLGRLLESGRDLRALGGVKLAAIGPGTAAALGAYRVNADLTPHEFRAESLADALVEELSRGRTGATSRLLLARASRGREVLAETLRAAGALVEQIVVYSSRDAVGPDPEIASLLSQRKIDWITVTSSAIARSLHGLYGERLRTARLASISPITSGVLRELGYEPACEAKEYDMPGLAAAILQDLHSMS